MDKPDSDVAQIFDITTTNVLVQFLSPIQARKVVVENLASSGGSIFFCTSLNDGASLVEIIPGMQYVLLIQSMAGYGVGEKIGYLKSSGGIVARVLVTK